MTAFIPPLPAPSRQHSPEATAQIAAIAARREARQRLSPRPAHWLKPRYGTTQYRYALSVGWISEEEHRTDFEAFRQRQERAAKGRGASPACRPRDANPAPPETRQYGKDYATEGIRDSRLTPNARNLLMLIRARCGDKLETTFTKGTMANCLGVSVRSIQRYVQELVRFEYIVVDIRLGWRGLHTGLIVRICEKVRPFYARPAMRLAWLQDEVAKTIKKVAKTLTNPGRTILSSTNKILLKELDFGEEKNRKNAESA